MSGEEVDDFEKAILITFAQNGVVDSNLKVSQSSTMPSFLALRPARAEPVHAFVPYFRCAYSDNENITSCF